MPMSDGSATREESTEIVLKSGEIWMYAAGGDNEATSVQGYE